jgi:two-component system chemotaxis response regulator CheB
MKRNIIVIGGSAGALDTLRTILAGLPADLPASIFVAIHIPSDFESLLPHLLSSVGPLPAIQPADREAIRQGTIYVAPADHHLLVEKGHVKVNRGPRENRHRPAIDPLFRSAARAYGHRVIGVVLSGQLNDGSAGLMAVKMRGGGTVVQNPDEALASEMPRNAIAYADPDLVLRAGEIAAYLVKATSESEAQIEQPEAPVTDELENETRTADLEDKVKKRLGKPSEFSCPECSGVLWETDGGGLLRFRCRVGHAYTADALRVELSESGEAAIWAAIRALEERAGLLRRMASRVTRSISEKYLEEASGYDKHVNTLRQILIENQGVAAGQIATDAA